MPDSGNESQPKTRAQMEAEYLEIVRQLLHEWNMASDEDREAAREIFMAALASFNALVMYRPKQPGE